MVEGDSSEEKNIFGRFICTIFSGGVLEDWTKVIELIEKVNKRPIL